MSTEEKSETITHNVLKKAKNEFKPGSSQSKHLQSTTVEKKQDEKSADFITTHAPSLRRKIIEKDIGSSDIPQKKISDEHQASVIPSLIKSTDAGEKKSSSKSLTLPEKMKYGISKLRKLGFVREEKSEEEVEEVETPWTSREVFRETYQGYPLARVSGTKTDVSYILPDEVRDEKKDEYGQEIEKIPSSIKQVFDPKKGAPGKVPRKIPSDYFKHRKEVPVKKPGIVLEEKKEEDQESPGFPTYSLKESDPSLKETLKSPLVSDSKIINRIEEASAKKSTRPVLDKLHGVSPSVAARAEQIYCKSAKQLPDITSKVAVVAGSELIHPSLEKIEKGTLGNEEFVSQLLFEVLGEEKPKRKPRKPKPTLAESKEIAQAANIELKSYFAEFSRWKSKGKSPLSKLRNQQISELETKPSTSQIQPETPVDPNLAHLKTEWQPRSLEKEEEETTVKIHSRKKAWVGSYIIGTDYWTKKEPAPAQEPEKIAFAMDKRQKPWYDLPLSASSLSNTSLESIPNVTREKLESMKMKLPETEVGIISAGRRSRRVMEEGGVLPSNWNEDLLNMFNEFTKMDELSATKNRLSLAKADKWLEMVGILDYKELSVINTGLCFKAAGGSRYQGLSFSEFKIFLELIAETKKMTFKDLLSRLKLAYMGLTYN